MRVKPGTSRRGELRRAAASLGSPDTLTSKPAQRAARARLCTLRSVPAPTAKADAALSRREPRDACPQVIADPISAFGGIVAFNRPVDEALAREIREFRWGTGLVFLEFRVLGVGPSVR